MKKTVFIAMKFDGPADADSRYRVMKEVSLEAGYMPIRGDEIKSGGAVVSEVNSHLEHSNLVIVDSSGDSHNVSYEIGYCHGVSRNPKTILLLRDNKDIPFNYRHFRHEIYSSASDLEKKLRKWYEIQEPLHQVNLGFTIPFFSKGNQRGDEQIMSKCFIESINHFKVTGRVEFYFHDGFVGFEVPTHPDDPSYGRVVGAVRVRQAPFGDTSERLVRVGVGIRNNKKLPDYHFWRDFSDYFGGKVQQMDDRLEYAGHNAEFARIKVIRYELEHLGSAEFRKGALERIIDPYRVTKENAFRDILDQHLLI